MLDLNSVMLGTHKPKELADYYEKVLGKEPDWTDGGWYGWRLGSGSLTVSEHLEVRGKATEPQRVMFNLETTEVEKEFERMQKAGAFVVKVPYEMGGMRVATPADPDGNYFQLMSLWEGE